VPDALAAAGDQRRCSGEAPPLGHAPAGSHHLLILSAPGACS
jgi:hypothetical protein